jgi:hypothetical protein
LISKFLLPQEKLNTLRKSQLTSHPKEYKAYTESITKALTFNPKKKVINKVGPKFLILFLESDKSERSF